MVGGCGIGNGFEFVNADDDDGAAVKERESSPTNPGSFEVSHPRPVPLLLLLWEMGISIFVMRGRSTDAIVESKYGK
jgi:hypothetical protein